VSNVDEIWEDWQAAVNVTAGRLEKWLDTGDDPLAK
jgi:hypothetical protein